MEAIGGYFGLELCTGKSLPWMAEATAMQSGRMALVYALRDRPVGTLWLPNFYCPPARKSIEALGWNVRGYALSENLGCDSSVIPGSNDVVLLVDFFGLSGDVVHADMGRFKKTNIVIDAAMSLGFLPKIAVPTAYSARKFVGVPDGGWLCHPSGKIELEKPDEIASLARSMHLFRRLGGDRERGRVDFGCAEESLNEDVLPSSMSLLTRSLLASVNFPVVASRRRNNYIKLGEGLAQLGLEVRPLLDDAIPLCCPVTVHEASLKREQLAKVGVFCPRYWPNLEVEIDDFVAGNLLEDTLYLPIDQRYGEDQMRRMTYYLSKMF